jgi:hypothetical protein
MQCICSFEHIAQPKKIAYFSRISLHMLLTFERRLDSLRKPGWFFDFGSIAHPGRLAPASLAAAYFSREFRSALQN